MKRYVKEFAHDIISNVKNNNSMKTNVKVYITAQAEKILQNCERGFITDNEAMRSLVNIMKEGF